MKNELLDKGIITLYGEISKDKINLVAGAVTQPFAEMVLTHQKSPATAGESPVYKYEHTNHIKTFYNSYTFARTICGQAYFAFSETF